MPAAPGMAVRRCVPPRRSLLQRSAAAWTSRPGRSRQIQRPAESRPAASPSPPGYRLRAAPSLRHRKKGLLVGVPCAQGTLRGMTASARGAIMAVLGEGIAMKQTYTISEKLQQLFVIFVPIFVTQAALGRHPGARCDDVRPVQRPRPGRGGHRGEHLGAGGQRGRGHSAGGDAHRGAAFGRRAQTGGLRHRPARALSLAGSLRRAGRAGATGLPLLLGAMDLEPEVLAIAHRYLIASRGAWCRRWPTMCFAASSTPWGYPGDDGHRPDRAAGQCAFQLPPHLRQSGLSRWAAWERATPRR